MGPHAGLRVFESGAPLSRAPAAVVMVHGRNASPQSILELIPWLERPDMAYLAPAAANGTWYPYSFMAPIAGNEPGISSGLHVLDALVARIVTGGIPQSRIVLLGFSQGACLASECAVRHAGRFGGVVVFSGGLIGPPGTRWEYPGSFDGTPVFLGCSDRDSHIPASRVDESAEVFARMGAAVTKRIYPGMGHTVNEDEIACAQRVLDAASATG